MQRFGSVIKVKPEKLDEYIGNNFAADMARMAEDPTTQHWWDVCKQCQEPLATRKEGEWWADMAEVFHHD